MAGRATPDQIMDYKMALQLYKTYNYMTPIIDWTNLNFNQILGTRQMNFATNKTNRKKVGMNSFSNRLWLINDKINLDWLNKYFETFKI